jgi:hypothetical protein
MSKSLTLIILLSFSLLSPTQAQTCNSAIIPSAPDSRYQDNADGTVTDKQTGLMWKRCSEGLSGSNCETGTSTRYNWQQVLQLPATLNISGGFAGYSDWRTPNQKELQSLQEVSCHNPAINTTLFPNTESTAYWSSSPTVTLAQAWYVNNRQVSFDHGNRIKTFWLRLVRSGM